MRSWRPSVKLFAESKKITVSKIEDISGNWINLTFGLSKENPLRSESSVDFDFEGPGLQNLQFRNYGSIYSVTCISRLPYNSNFRYLELTG